MKATQTTEGVAIVFSRQTNLRLNNLLYLKAFGSLVAAVLCITSVLNLLREAGDNSVEMLILACVATVFFIAFSRYIGKASARESIMISPEYLTITNTAVLKKSIEQYDIRQITNLQFRGKQHATDHPLKGESFDYLGFQTEQELINTIHDDGNLSFDYNDKTIFFGKSVPSWDAEELDKVIRKLTEDRLYIANLPESIEIDPVDS